MAEENGKGKDDATPTPEELANILEQEEKGGDKPPETQETEGLHEIDTPTGKKSISTKDALQMAQSYTHSLPDHTRIRQELADVKREMEAMKATSTQRTTEETTIPEFDTEEERRLYLLERRQDEADKRQQETDRQQQERNLQEWTMRTYQDIDKAVSEHEIGKTFSGEVLEGVKDAINTTYIKKQGMTQERLSVKQIAKAFLDGMKQRDLSERDRFVNEHREKMKSTRVEVGGGVPLPDNKKIEDLTSEEIENIATQIFESSED